VRTPDDVWAELAEVRAALESAGPDERADLERRRKSLRAEAERLAGDHREDDLRRELAEVEAELEALLDRHIGGRTKKRGFVMGFVWGDHDSGDHLAELNRKMDEAGGRAELEARRVELRRQLGLEE
jgi:hypothetical protein